MTRPIDDLDVPTPDLEQQVRDLVARQNAQRADESAAVLTALLSADAAGWHATRAAIAARQEQLRQANTTQPTPEEGQS